MKRRISITAFGLAAILCSGCTTVKMPKLDFVKFPEFLEETRNIEAYPKVSDAPQTPDDLRSAKEWDKAARDILAKIDDPYAAQGEVSGTPFSPAEIQALKARVRAYKLDDPQ